jgi:hypothetical protein
MTHEVLGFMQSDGGARSLVEERFLLADIENEEDTYEEGSHYPDGGPSQFRAFLFDSIVRKVSLKV